MTPRDTWCADIPPVAEPPARPLWSVMIPTFNCARFLAQTLESVLAQDPGPDTMQIEVVDDCSTRDDPEAVVSRVGGNRVTFFRQQTNVGHIRNFETCLSRARGHLVHLLHGDDYVRDGFYRAMGAAFTRVPDCGAAYCRTIYMDENGHWQSMTPVEQPHPGLLDNAVVRLAAEQKVMTPSVVVRRSVYEHLGAFDRRLTCAEDWEMWVRIAAHYPVWFEPEPLAVYRMHTDSNTGRNVRTGNDTRHIHLAIDLFRGHLPRERADALVRSAKETYARAALDTSFTLVKRRDFEGARNVAREAFRLSRSPSVFLHAVQLGGRLLLS